MFDQKVFFRIMIWSLGAAALLGVVAVLTASFDVVGRIIATAFLTSVGSAYIWQTAQRFENHPLAARIAHIGGFLSFFFSLCGTWELGEMEHMWATASILLGCCTAVAICLALMTQKRFLLTGRVGVVGSIVPGVFWLLDVWSDAFGDRTTANGFVILGWSVACAICLVGTGTAPPRHWRWIGVGAAALGLALSLYGISQDVPSDRLMKFLFVLGSTVFVIVHAVLCYEGYHVPDGLMIRVVAICSTVVTTILVDTIVLMEINGDNIIVRFSIASGIVAATSTLVTAFVMQRNMRQARRNRSGSPRLNSPETKNPLSVYRRMKIECPKCLHESIVNIGESSCERCGLQILIEVSEP